MSKTSSPAVNNYSNKELLKALDESVKLQSHYAGLLNMYDGGKRMQFESTDEWIERLRLIYKME